MKMKKTRWGKLLACTLAVAMSTMMLPAAAFANGTGGGCA